MASNRSFNTTDFEGRYLQFSWSQTSQSIEDNTTTISWTLKGAGTAESSWYMAGNFKVVIDGKTVYSTASDDRITLYNGTTVASGSYTFTHNADGTKGFSAYAEGGIYTFAVNCSGSGSFTLDTIARASQPTCITWPENTQDVGEFGDTISIHMNRNSDNFVHTVRYAFGSRTGTCINAETGKATNKDVTTGFKWKIPEDLMDLLPNDTEGSGLIYADTYHKNGTLIGTKYCGFTAKVPASVKPTCSLTLKDVTGVDQIYGSPVKGLSQIEVSVKAGTARSSPIASYSVTANGVKYSDATATTGYLKDAGSSVVSATVTDGRGRSGTASYTMTVQDYAAPAITALAVHRCKEDGTAYDQGNFVKVTFSASVSSMNNKNTALYKLYYKKSSASSFDDPITLPLTNQYSVNFYSYIFAADGNSAYDVKVTVTDRHNTKKPAERNTSASTAFTLMNWNAAGNGIRFGGVSESENTFQNDLEFCQRGNSYAFQPGAFSGERGYTCLAQITLNELNVNAPIVFKINRRAALQPMNVYIRFASSSSSTDPALDSITYEGDNYGAFLVKTAVSTWKLYVDNTGGWSNPCVQDWFTTDNQMTRISVDFPNEQITGSAPSVLGTYYRATPVISRSILDAFYPVGYILLLYSHADPNTMYPGSTWVRIENQFLWATTPGGTIGQTGGASTHTLTLEEIPNHDHTYGVEAWAVKSFTSRWGGASGSTGAFVNEAQQLYARGGGKPHNNMPPYIQVSVWRRTA